MYLWQAGRLADELRQQSLTERDKFTYVLAATGLHFLVGGGSLLTSAHDDRTLAFLAISAIVSFQGLTSCFRINQVGDAQHFIERYVCLAVPIIVRLCVLGYGAYRLLWLGLKAALDKPGTPSFTSHGVVSAVYAVLMLIVYFAMLRHFIRRAAMPATA